MLAEDVFKDASYNISDQNILGYFLLPCEEIFFVMAGF